jgi:virginiamycin B lyase
LAVGIREFPIPTANSNPFWITQGTESQLYFTAGGADQIGAYNPSTHGFVAYPLPGLTVSPTSYITSAPDGNLYITSPTTNSIEQFNPVTRVAQNYLIPTPNLGPSYITTGPDGNVYFTTSGGNIIEQFNLTSHAFTTYFIPTANPGVTALTSGAGNALWFVETSASKIAELVPATHSIKEVPLPIANTGAGYIAAGTDGDLYFTEPNTNALGQYNPTTRVFTSYPIPVANSGAGAITSGSDGNIYLAEPRANQIGQFSPITRHFAQFLIPTASSGVSGITSGPDGNIYFTETSANKIGSVVLNSSTGTTTQLTVTPQSSVVGQVTTLTATVTAAAGSRATGTVVFFIDGTAQPPVKLTSRGGQAQARLSTKLPDGEHTITALYKGNSASSSSVSNVVTVFVSPAPGDGPTVVHLVRLGFHAEPTTLVLTFDKLLDPATAQNPGNYRITATNGSRVRIASVSYDPATLTVTVSPKERLDLHRTYRFTVVGTPPTGVTDTAGNLLDGALTGHPGSNFVTTLSARYLRLNGSVTTQKTGARLARG